MAVRSLEHVLVLSDEIDASRDFYRDVIGLEQGPRPPLEFPGYWMYIAGEAVSCLHIAERTAYLDHAVSIGLPDPRLDAAGTQAGSGTEAGLRSVGVDHIAFDADDHEAALAAIARRSLHVVHNQVPDGPRQLFVTDPGGVLVEINVKASV